MTTLSMTEARAHLPEVLDRVAAGEEITISRHGAAVAVVVRPDALRARRAERAFALANVVHELIKEGGSTALGPPTISPARAEELIADVRRGREAR